MACALNDIAVPPSAVAAVAGCSMDTCKTVMDFLLQAEETAGMDAVGGGGDGGAASVVQKR